MVCINLRDVVARFLLWSHWSVVLS